MLLKKINLLFFGFLFSVIANFSHDDLILAGDWIVVSNDVLNKDGGPPHVNKNLKEKVKSIWIFFLNLRDVFCDLNSSKKKKLTQIQTQPLYSNTTRLFLAFGNFCIFVYFYFVL